jgi:peptidoglycan hydrolase-like protein with peptidoglycan-binding domain
MFVVSANAGFWSSALGTAVGGGGNKNYYYDKDAKEEPKKIQQTLSKLGFYSGKFDGNLNSFDTRSAIEEFQNYYNLNNDGILNKVQKQDLLYIHDLIKNYKIELKNPKNKDSKRLKKLYKAFDKIEKKLSNNNFSKQYMSSKFKKEIQNRRNYIAQENKNKKSNFLKHSKRYIDNGDGTITDKYSGLQWKKCLEGLKGKQCSKGKIIKTTKEKINRFAKNKFAGYNDWRIPTIKELRTLVYCSNKSSALQDLEFQSKSTQYNYGGCSGKYKKPTINFSIFSDVKHKNVWSSESLKKYKNNKYVVDFSNGRVDSIFYSHKASIRLVRGNLGNKYH